MVHCVQYRNRLTSKFSLIVNVPVYSEYDIRTEAVILATPSTPRPHNFRPHKTRINSAIGLSKSATIFSISLLT